MTKPNIWIRHYHWPWWLKSLYWSQKWLWCSWLHKKHRCNPGVPNCDENYWHCDKCHPCGEERDRLMNHLLDGLKK